MMISDNLIIFVPNIVRAKNNFVRTRLSCFVKKLIEANGYKTTNDSSENYDIIHFPSYLDYIDNDYVIKEVPDRDGSVPASYDLLGKM